MDPTKGEQERWRSSGADQARAAESNCKGGLALCKFTARVAGRRGKVGKAGNASPNSQRMAMQSVCVFCPISVSRRKKRGGAVKKSREKFPKPSLLRL